MEEMGFLPGCEEDPAGVARLNQVGQHQGTEQSSSSGDCPRTAAQSALSGRPNVAFESIHVIQKWLSTGTTDFLEIFCGWQQLTYRVREVGLQAADGIDLRVVSHGRAWPLGNPVVDAELAWLICFGLRPRATHSGTPCTHMSTLGARDQAQETQEHVTIAREIMDH